MLEAGKKVIKTKGLVEEIYIFGHIMLLNPRWSSVHSLGWTEIYDAIETWLKRIQDGQVSHRIRYLLNGTQFTAVLISSKGMIRGPIHLCWLCGLSINVRKAFNLCRGSIP